MAQDPEAEAAQPTEDTQGQEPQVKKPGKIQETLDMLGKKAQEVGGQAQQLAKQAKDASDARLSLQGQLKAANESLKSFLNPKLDVEKQIPVALMKGAKGIVFLSSLKASFGIGIAVGAGIFISKLDYNQGWSGPCSIGLLGGQLGFNIGAQKTDLIVILREENAVKLFSGKGQIKFGADASIAAGPHGRDAQIAVGANDKGYAATVSYSMAQGLYVGFALEGQGIVPREDCNEKFYGKKIPLKDILEAPLPADIENEDYAEICALVDSYAEIKDDDAAAADVDENADDQKQPL